MSFNNPFASHPENAPPAHAEIEEEFKEYVPHEFVDDPSGYFQREGKNIKQGDVKLDDAGNVHEDPTAVKDLPTWHNQNGDELHVVGRRVNTIKGAVGESGDPFYEYRILEQLHTLGLPAARPVAKVEHNGMHIIVTKRIPGIRWSERESLALREYGYTDEDIVALQTQAEQQMEKLKQRFEAAGVVRRWKLKDMVFQVDIANRKVLAVIPTDWERTKIEIPR